MKESDNFYKKCNDAVALMSKISKDLCKVEEIVNDLKFYFETHNDGVWKGGIAYKLGVAKYELDKHYQSVKSVLP